MRGPYTWSYLPAGKKSHAVIPAKMNLPDPQMDSAVCGCGVLAVLPPQVKWQADPEGVTVRDKCRQCLTILEREANV